jgi:uncharacterized protein (DUF2237 family)
MKYIKSYKLFESSNNLTSIIENYISSCQWDIENSLGNCAFFAKDFYEWSKKQGIDCKLIYLEQDDKFAIGDEIEDHIIPMVDGQLIDFVYTELGVSRRVRLNSTDAIKRQTSPEITTLTRFSEKYSKWGYNTIREISYQDAYLGNSPKCQTIESPNKKSNQTVQYIVWSEFKKRPELYDKLTKAHFSYDSIEDEEEYGVSDINQFDVEGGKYFCTTDNCTSHYRDNPGYCGEDDYELEDDTIIAVSSDDSLIYDDAYKTEIMKKADGFYLPEYDTYGLVIWNKEKIK